MSKYDKLINKILSKNKDLRFSELVKVLESAGYEMRTPKGGSSHVTFRKSEKMPITIPKGHPINKAYIELVRNAIFEDKDG